MTVTFIIIKAESAFLPQGPGFNAWVRELGPAWHRVQGQKKKQSLGYPVIWNSNNDQDCSHLAPLGSETLSWRWLMKVFPTNDSLRWFKNINNCKYEKLIQEKKWLSISLTNYYFLIYGIISGALIEFLSVSQSFKNCSPSSFGCAGWVFVAADTLSLLYCVGFLSQRLPLWSMGTQQFQCMDLVALRHMRSSWTTCWTQVPHTGRCDSQPLVPQASPWIEFLNE